MRAITLYQPWAQLVAIGAKRIETRSWRTTHRGEIAIHASKRFPTPAKAVWHAKSFRQFVIEPSVPRGAIIAVVTIDACEETSDPHCRFAPADWVSALPQQEREFGDYGLARWGWFLSDVRRLPEPVPCRGSLGIWTVPDDVEDRVREMLAMRTPYR